jgi:cell division protease FtsH
MMASMLGGRAAEELIFAEFTTGAASDITQATKIARGMVIEYGMSELGPINLGPQVDMTEWGQGFYEPSPVSPEMAARIDNQVKKIVDEAYKKAFGLLTKNKKKLDLLAKKLVEQETVEGEEFEKLMKTK